MSQQRAALWQAVITGPGHSLSQQHPRLRCCQPTLKGLQDLERETSEAESFDQSFHSSECISQACGCKRISLPVWEKQPALSLRHQRMC